MLVVACNGFGKSALSLFPSRLMSLSLLVNVFLNESRVAAAVIGLLVPSFSLLHYRIC